jgi:hypothetical protein
MESAWRLLISREELRGAIARGYCHKYNEEKELDPLLLEAIEEEIWNYLSKALGEVKCDGPDYL